MTVLGVGDLRLAAKPDIPHGDAVSRVDMRPDDEGAVLIEHLIRLQDIRGCADLATSEPILGNAQREEQVLHQPDRRRWVENGEDVKPERGRELEPRQDQYLAHQLAVFGQQFCFVRVMRPSRSR